MNSIKTIALKKTMAIVGLAWFVYVIFHLLTLINFHYDVIGFNDYHVWLNQLLTYQLLIVILFVSLIFHLYVGVNRQIANNHSRETSYKKPYPKLIPRWVAWSGASILLAFIVFHFIQMRTLDDSNLHQHLLEIFSDPIMVLIYFFGTSALCAHLHHGLSNVLQTLGITAKVFSTSVLLIVGFIFIGFISIPASVYVK